MGPGKSWIGKSQAIRPSFLSFSHPGHENWPGSQRAKRAIRVEKVGPGKSWIGKSQVIELIQDHLFFPSSNPGHGNWPGSPRAKRANRVEKSWSWEVLDW